ncbi:MAG: GIY-YIG nuclease family protein [Ignavibacteriales bacterium]|nr:GIY-YIG nuclease family protein [Ignavibacteriales bacterium]
MYFVYALRSLKDNRFYIGMTSDVIRRFERHQRGGVSSTKNHRPFVLLYSEELETRVQARQREKFLKSGAGHKFLKSLPLK